MSIRAVHRTLAAAIALLVAAPVAAQSHFYYGHNKIQYEDFDWHILQTPNFDIYHDADAAELASVAAAEAEATYLELVHRFGIELPRRVPLLVYATNLHFRQTNVIPGHIPRGVGGFFEFMKGRVVIPADGDIHRFRRVIRHEVVHVFTFTRINQVLHEHRRQPQTLPPLWFTEGLAEYWSGERDHLYEAVLRDAVASNQLVRLEDLHRIGGFLVYKQGESICHFISETYGEEKLWLLIENVWRDTDFRRVMEHVLGESFAEVAERYDRWVRASYYPELATSVPPDLIGERLASAAFTGKPLMVSLPDGDELMVYVGNRGGYTNIYSAPMNGARAVAEPEVLVRGERGPRFESMHPFESRMDANNAGLLAFVAQSGPSDVIHVLDLTTGALRSSHRPQGLVAVYSPTWAPDGMRIGFSGIDHGGFSDLYAIDLVDESVERLTHDRFDVRDPHWSPCGRWIVFSSDRGAGGGDGFYHLFALDTAAGALTQLTFGQRRDSAPRFVDGGRQIVYTSARRAHGGPYGPQDVWLLEPDFGNGRASIERRLTALTSAAFDPHLSDAGVLTFTAYERGRFRVRSLDLSSSIDAGDQLAYVPPPLALTGPGRWEHPAYTQGETRREGRQYRRSYSLDIAQGGVAANPLFGTTGGGALALSDLLGDDRILVSAFLADVPDRPFLDGLNFAVTRVNLARRTNIGYGAFRLSGLRFDRTDPDAYAGYPVFFEQTTGGFAALSYPISRFQRVEVSALAAWNRKEIPAGGGERDALLIGPAVSLTHDNALYGPNGPIEGWKAQLTAGATTDPLYRNVHHYSLSADVRHYQRFARSVSLASWGMARTNWGREARLWLLGGSWDLRGFPFLRVRGRNQWFTSHELRVTLAEAPSAHLPLLAPFGISNVRGALFVDAAHSWNDDYRQHEPQLIAGRTLGAVGSGLRVNLFGGLVLRYDVGWRFEDGFVWEERAAFRQFFFGYDF